MKRLLMLSILVNGVLNPLGAQGWPAQDRLEKERCTAWTGGPSASEWLQRASEATGVSVVGGRTIAWSGHETDVQYFQSDRPYPPYLASVSARRWYFRPEGAVERAETPDLGAAVLTTDQSTFVARDTLLRPMASFHGLYNIARALDPFAALADFKNGNAVVVEVCTFRGYPRVVLRHGGERLYLDRKSAMPVKRERVEAHDTWGQIRAEYTFTNWWRGNGVSVPMTAVRYVDGVMHLRRDVQLPLRRGEQVVRLVPGDSAPRMDLPPADHRSTPATSSVAVPVDTVRVDARTYLLRTPAYTHAVTLQRDTVFLFDATTAEWRSRADSAWIATLFPGKHPVVLVVTDLAWPHVGGVRFWAARGATVISHRLSQEFIRELLARRWTLAPDVLERARARVTPRLRFFDQRLDLAGGAVQLRAIDGVASEGALYARVPSAGFLWAGDYIQQLATPSQYATEVIATVTRDGLEAARVAAQHLPLTPWPDVVAANRRP